MSEVANNEEKGTFEDESEVEVEVEAGSEVEAGDENASDAPEGETDELEKAREEIRELKDSWSRERAEFLNYKKRMVQEQARFRKQVIGSFVGELLPVLDNLKAVLQTKAEDEAVRNFISGVEMIHNEFVDVLKKSGISVLRPHNERFDPNFMQAIATEDRDDLEHETVLEVFQDGYIVEHSEDDRHVLRPARVKVGKPSPKTE